MNGSIEGVRMWLSGSISDKATADEKQRIDRFVAALAKQVFLRNGRLVHGSHPTILPTLLTSAKEHKDLTGNRAGLVVVVSRLFSKDPVTHNVDVKGWNQLCLEPVIQTREGLGETEEASRHQSLDILRDTLLAQCNVIVAVGGKWWDVAMAQAGVPQEIELAAQDHLPLFPLGGLGGATQSYLKDHPEILRRCRNGMTEEENLELAAMEDADKLATRVVDQIARLPVRYRDPNAGRPFRILCLDGGGIRGAYTAAVLAYWEKALNCRIVDHFDLVAGTSTGGLLAIGLGLEIPPHQMLEFYQTQGGEIFPTESDLDRLWHSFRHWFGSKFDQEILREKLKTIFDKAPRGSDSLDKSLCRLLITSYNTESDEIVIFRTPHRPFQHSHKNQDPLLAALATSAAPTYFDPLDTQAVIAPIQAVDGGVWANNPCTVAVAEAVGPLRIPIERIDVLSIGTTYSPAITGQPLLLNKEIIGKVAGLGGGWKASLAAKMLWKDMRIRGKIGWVANIAEFLMKTQAQTASQVCQDLLEEPGGKTRFLRIDDASIGVELDDVRAIKNLIGKGQATAARHLNQVSVRFLNGVPADDWR